MRAILIPKKNWLTWGVVAFVALTLATITAISLLAQKPAEAYTTGFNPARIIDDYIFTDTSTMNPSQIARSHPVTQTEHAPHPIMVAPILLTRSTPLRVVGLLHHIPV